MDYTIPQIQLSSTEEKAFFEKVSKETEGKGCWIWTGAREKVGYGSVRFRSAAIRASRLSFLVFNGPIPEHRFVCHKCDNKLCVNPEHLHLGDPLSNSKEAYDRGLMPVGETHHWAKFDNIAIEEARKLYSTGTYKQSDLAKLFGTSQSYMCRVLNGQRHKHN